jgi:ABC-2 type transport system permease protein
MGNSKSNRLYTLLQREMREYKTSLFWTPIITAAALAFVMLISVVFANRVSIVGDTMVQVLMDEGRTSGMNISINFDEDMGEKIQTYTIEQDTEEAESEDWNFSQEWVFNPTTGEPKDDALVDEVASLNSTLNLLHNFLILILILVTYNYLLGSLYDDRKDRSILFWRSMPVSEWEEVLSKMAVAMLAAPLVYIAVSIVFQLVAVLLAMLMLWRLDMDPFELVIGHIEFAPLFLNQIAGWLLSMLWLAPAYAWMLLASSAAKRSPFMLAIAPVIGLALCEETFLGTEYISSAVRHHIPHIVDGGSSMPFYFNGTNWGAIDYPQLAGGLVFTVLALWGAVYMRRYRFDV